jgi:hypothetical protein
MAITFFSSLTAPVFLVFEKHFSIYPRGFLSPVNDSQQSQRLPGSITANIKYVETIISWQVTLDI